AGGEVLHGDRVRVLQVHEVVDADDVRVRDTARHLELQDEAPDHVGVDGELGREDLQHQALVHEQILDQVHGPEAAAPHALDHAEAADQLGAGGELFEIEHDPVAG